MGQLNGEFISYYKDGVVKHKGSWNNGRRNDKFEWFYENGQLNEQVTYKDGKLDWSN